MNRLFVLAAVLFFSNSAFTQQPTASPSDADKPRVFITDSNSWSAGGSAGGSNGSFGGSSYGGARPQTAEIIKTFGQKCPQVLVNNRVDASNYVVELDHEGGKSVFAHKDKIAVFAQKTGDSIFSKSTLSVGGAVEDACSAIQTHWSAHASELKPASGGYGAGGYGQGGYGGVQTASAAQSAVTVDANAANCDIEVDGNFVGNTPSTINLTPGKHQIVVKKTGYQDWTRNMVVASGSIHLSAEMIAK
ncbi:PEGA domain-containing protein [Edaphobacter bradus]|uniref:PEGA domain-containing protein n=1 Tax=Edaphobacter bradus TaxID=2259016 RepID=UPI0021E0C2DB|nr:PEGA domain-containing protein [Edaphobacter bradus]